MELDSTILLGPFQLRRFCVCSWEFLGVIMLRLTLEEIPMNFCIFPLSENFVSVVALAPVKMVTFEELHIFLSTTFSKIFPPCSTNFSADTFLALFPQFLISVSYFLKLSNWALFQDPCDFMLDKYLPCFISFSPTMAIPFRNLTLLILFDLCLILQCDYL